MYLDKATSYIDTNCMQRKDAENMLNEFQKYIKWLPSGKDSLLHIGSRTGDVLFDYVFPLVPKNFKYIVGIDKSEAMVSFANEHYRHPKLFFRQFDISDKQDIEIISRKYGQFDHMTSFCSLHWFMNQELAFKNIFDLLAPNGDFLVSICQDHPIYQHYSDMMTLEKWKTYRQEMVLSTSPYFGSSDPVKMLKDILKKAGFEDIFVDIKDCQFEYEKQLFIDSTITVVPFLCHVPETFRREFLITYENKVMTKSQKLNKTLNDHTTIVQYRMLIAYAKKGSNTKRYSTTQTPETQHVLKSDEVRMYNAKRYHETNCMQRKDALDTLIEFENIFQWKPKGDDLLLDIGTGSGDVLFDYILPLMPQKTRIIGSDKSFEMIEYASEHFAHSRISYEKLDIENENDIVNILKKYGQFNHVTSFCCLHWALKQYEVMENIFDLLQPGGDLLLTICQHHPLYEHYAECSELPKWLKYRPDMKKSTTPYFRNECPEKELYKRLENAGFEDINVILKYRLHPYDSQVFIDSTVPVAPFLDKISESLKNEFLQIYIDKVMSLNLPAPYKPNNKRNDGITMVPYRMLVAHARKPADQDTRV